MMRHYSLLMTNIAALDEDTDSLRSVDPNEMDWNSATFETLLDIVEKLSYEFYAQESNKVVRLLRTKIYIRLDLIRTSRNDMLHCSINCMAFDPPKRLEELQPMYTIARRDTLSQPSMVAHLYAFQHNKPLVNQHTKNGDIIIKTIVKMHDTHTHSVENVVLNSLKSSTSNSSIKLDHTSTIPTTTMRNPLGRNIEELKPTIHVDAYVMKATQTTVQNIPVMRRVSKTDTHNRRALMSV
eukprot:282136_1